MANQEVTIDRSRGLKGRLFEFLTNLYAAGSAMVRATVPTSVSFSNGTDSSFLDKRGFTMISIGPLPEAINGRTLSILEATDANGTGKAIPEFLDNTGAYAAYKPITAATGKIITLQADTAAIHYIGFRVSGAAVTCDLPMRLTA